jgi:trans-aconitate methyltransferase
MLGCLKKLKKLVPKTKVILELMAGEGRNIKWLQKCWKGVAIHCVDGSSEMVKALKAKGKST